MKKYAFLVGVCVALMSVSGCTATSDEGTYPLVSTTPSGPTSSASPSASGSRSSSATATPSPSATSTPTESGAPAESEASTGDDASNLTNTVHDTGNDSGGSGGSGGGSAQGGSTQADSGQDDPVTTDPTSDAGAGSGESAPTVTPTVTMPELVNMAEADALAELVALGIDGQVSYAPSDTVASGLVISTSVGAGEAVAQGTVVELVVSQGVGSKALITVVSYVGQPSDEARGELEAAGLVVVTSTEHSLWVAPGNVISQDPGTGQLSPGDTVTLVISDGPELVAVPAVVGLSGEAACDAMDQAGFACQIVCDQDTCESDDFTDQVTWTAPVEGTMVYQGFSVNVYVA